MILVVPFLAELTGESSASMNVLQVEQSTSQDVHALFKAVLSEAECVELLTAFSLKENNSPVSHGTGNASGNTDVSYDVVLTNPTAFTDVLVAAMERATVMAGYGDDDKDISAGLGAHFSTALDVSNSAAAYMREKMRDYILAQLTKVGMGPLASIIAASNLSSVAVTLGSNAGAADMKDRILAGSEAERRLLLSQIPRETVQHYIANIFPPSVAANVYQPEFLPMKGGDKLTFVFVTKVTDPDQIVLGNPTAPAVNVVGAPTATTLPLVGSYVTPFLGGQVVRRLGFVLQLGEKNAFFKRNIDDVTDDIAEEIAALNGEHEADAYLFDLSQSLVRAEDMSYGARLPYTLDTVWSTTSATDISNLIIALTDAGTAITTICGDAALTAAVTTHTELVLSEEILAVPTIIPAIAAYNKALWKLVLTREKKRYEDAESGVYAAAGDKVWNASLNSSVSDKTLSPGGAQVQSNGY